MPNLDSLFGAQVDNMQRAMSRATQRHAMLTDNLANINTPGYKRKDIDFNIILDGKMQNSERQQKMLDQKAQEASDRVSLRLDGNNVDLEREVMSVAETQERFEALSLMTANYFSGLKNVIREGK